MFLQDNAYNWRSASAFELIGYDRQMQPWCGCRLQESPVYLQVWQLSFANFVIIWSQPSLWICFQRHLAPQHYVLCLPKATHITTVRQIIDKFVIFDERIEPSLYINIHYRTIIRCYVYVPCFYQSGRMNVQWPCNGRIQSSHMTACMHEINNQSVNSMGHCR